MSLTNLYKKSSKDKSKKHVLFNPKKKKKQFEACYVSFRERKTRLFQKIPQFPKRPMKRKKRTGKKYFRHVIKVYGKTKMLKISNENK